MLTLASHRPATRTTKTISSGSDSSRSSLVMTDRSMKDIAAGGDLTYISFQPEILSCELVRQGLEGSPSSCPFSPLDSARSSSRASSGLHETHFGDSEHSIPCTVVGPRDREEEERRESLEPLLSPAGLPLSPLEQNMQQHRLGGRRILPLGLAAPVHLLPRVQLR